MPQRMTPTIVLYSSVVLSDTPRSKCMYWAMCNSHSVHKVSRSAACKLDSFDCHKQSPRHRYIFRERRTCRCYSLFRKSVCIRILNFHYDMHNRRYNCKSLVRCKYPFYMFRYKLARKRSHSLLYNHRCRNIFVARCTRRKRRSHRI